MESQLHILQHALGVGDYGDKPSYRNNFVTGEGGSDYQICQALVKQELMKIQPMSKVLTGGDDCFIVTPRGIDYVAINSQKRPPETRKSKSKLRYARFREYGDGFDSFIDFCRWDSCPERSWNERKM